jgi:predicted RecA/RadA family phage recombinase
MIMGAVFKHRGDTVEYIPAADVTAGDVVVQGDLVGVAVLDIKTGMLGGLAVSGVFDFPKLTGTGNSIAAGVKLYWNAAGNAVMTTDSSGTYKYVGKAVAAVDINATTVRVRLSQ